MAFLRGLALVAIPFLARGDASALRGPCHGNGSGMDVASYARRSICSLHELQISHSVKEMYRPASFLYTFLQ